MFRWSRKVTYGSLSCLFFFLFFCKKKTLKIIYFFTTFIYLFVAFLNVYTRVKYSYLKKTSVMCASPPGCHYAGVDYSSGQEFLDPADRCKHCTCLNGHVTCRQKPCYNPGCSHPAPSSGHCCPVCDGETLGSRV